MAPALAPGEAELLADGCVIPAHPLALTADRRLDERRQRALTRYYLAAGAGGVAVGVHTTQFAIRTTGLYEPVLALAKETLDQEAAGQPFVRIAGAVGDVRQAVAEAELAAGLGYHAVLLGPATSADHDEQDLLLRAKAVGEVLPVIGFYLQEAVGGRYLSREFWRALADLPCVVAAKLAPFNRYQTLEAVRGIAEAERGSEVALYTGNDDAIVTDLLMPYAVDVGGQLVERRIVGGLLGQWAVWTKAAVEILDRIRKAWDGDDAELRALLALNAAMTDANAAVFDAANGFAGCIAGVHEVLRRQGLLAGTWCLDADETLSPGQAEEIARVSAAYPELTDDAFVTDHLDDWLR
ncbi:MAG TPA: dihydrodipicolinate synthase family protein [Actinopolymorphaceae bacterium]|jgi:dihydrodipicolinate synthase/N-acetylneuraminate lyase|nr:dihydrodipicolinate synthase family protein [Actinopolymorphaceae bacterium]